MRIGQGFDVHTLVRERKCIIGGVTIPHEFGLLGHSDADVLLHAITDTILGAAGLGDIGHLFPDDDLQFKNADSRILLKEAWKVVDKAFTIGNIDCTILAEKPKMQPYLSQMKQNIAEICEIPVSNVNIKATTMEQMGFIGRKEGIGAMAVALLETKN